MSNSTRTIAPTTTWYADLDAQTIACATHRTDSMVEITEDEVYDLTPGLDDPSAEITPADACDFHA